MLWGEKLWDKFDIVEKHTEKGIQFSRRVVQFFEEYASKKREHAQQMRKLVKQYNVNYKKGNPTGAAGKKGGVKETKDYSYETAFYVMLEHVNEMATLEETMASDLEEKIILTAKHRHNDFMSKRKQFLSAGRDHNVRLSNSLKFLENAENNFKKACKARDEAQTAFTKADNDMNVTKALVAKCEQTLKTKTDLMENSKQEYLQQLKQTNDAQHDHFFEQMPLVFSDLETLDTDRIQDLQSLIHDFANLHENYQPHLSKCLLAVHQCAEDMNVDEDLELVVTRHESTLFPPGDRTFIDYSNPNAIHDAPSNISPTSQRPQVQPRSSKTQTTTSTLSSNEGGGAHQNNTSPCSTQSLPGADASMAADATYNSSNSSGNTNSGGDPKCVTLAPSLNNNNNPPVTGKDKDKKKRGRFLSFMSKKSKTFNPNNQPNLLQEFSDIPFVNEAPPQQRMKTEAKIVELEREIEKLEREREGMLKLKTSYANNTAYGDAKSLEPKIARVGQELDSRRLELKRYTEFLTAISTGLTRPARANSSAAQNRISRDYQSGSGGEYGESSSNYYAGGVGVGGKHRSNTLIGGGGTSVGGGGGVLGATDHQQQQLEVGSHQSHLSGHSSEDFDYDYEDEDDGTYSEIPEPAVGLEMYRNGSGGGSLKCKVLYSYEKSTDAALSIQEGEVLDVIEAEDENNDGWTKVRRHIDDIVEEGYVPTSYIKSILEYPSSGSHSPVPPAAS